MTKVIFRKFKTGDVVALFPDIPWNDNGDITSYTHVGQHGPANKYIISVTKAADKHEYEPLLKELKDIGYVGLEIRKRL